MSSCALGFRFALTRGRGGNVTDTVDLSAFTAKAAVIPNVSLLRATSLEGPWNPVNASFLPLSSDTILAEGAMDAASPQSFYRVRRNGESGSVGLLSAEKRETKFRVRFQWAP